EALGKTVLLGVDDEVDVALTVQQHIFRAVLGDRAKAHLLEQHAERRRIGRCVFDEFKAVGPERIVPERRGRHGDCVYCRTMLMLPSFSCASTSDAMYLSPKPSRLALTMLWCTASPTIAGEGSASTKCV